MIAFVEARGLRLLKGFEDAWNTEEEVASGPKNDYYFNTQNCHFDRLLFFLALLYALALQRFNQRFAFAGGLNLLHDRIHYCAFQQQQAEWKRDASTRTTAPVAFQDALQLLESARCEIESATQTLQSRNDTSSSRGGGSRRRPERFYCLRDIAAMKMVNSSDW